MNNRIILIVVILIILISLILVNRESFKICSSNNLLNPEYLCNNYNTCCSGTEKSCSCNDPILKTCIENEKECENKFCQNMGKTECNEFCKKRKNECCNYIGKRISNTDIKNKIPRRGFKDSNTFICKMDSPNIDHYKCGRICYSDPECTGYSIILKNTCKLYGKKDKLIPKFIGFGARLGNNPNFAYYGKI